MKKSFYCSLNILKRIEAFENVSLRCTCEPQQKYSRLWWEKCMAYSHVHQPTAHTGSRHLTAVFLPLKMGLNFFSERTKWLKNNPDNFTKFQFPKVFSAMWPKTATASTTARAFRSCTIFQCNLLPLMTKFPLHLKHSAQIWNYLQGWKILYQALKKRRLSHHSVG